MAEGTIPQAVVEAGRSARVGAIVSLVLLGAAFVGIARRDRLAEVLRERVPRDEAVRAAWHQGAHEGVACVECHVEPGLTNRLEHKLVAMTNSRRTCSASPPSRSPRKLEPIPNERCQRCHPNPVVNKPGFSHAQHAGDRGASCATPRQGTASRPARWPRPGSSIPRPRRPCQVQQAVYGQGAADLPNHVSVACSDCHKMSATPCETCHTQPADHRKTSTNACATCHQTGEKFVVHPPDRSLRLPVVPQPAEGSLQDRGRVLDLSHEAGRRLEVRPHDQARRLRHLPPSPGKHQPGDCEGCHTKPGVSWAFAHNNAANCSACHKAPAGHRSGNCATCHRKPGVSWAFTHPGSSNCATCHPVPRTTAPVRARPATASPASRGRSRTRAPATAPPAIRGPPVTALARAPRVTARPASHGRSPTPHRELRHLPSSARRSPQWLVRDVPSPGWRVVGVHPHASSCCGTCHRRPVGPPVRQLYHVPPQSRRVLALHAPELDELRVVPHPSRRSPVGRLRHMPPRRRPLGRSCTPAPRAARRATRLPRTTTARACASCHSPSRAWSSAVFSHPSIPGGEHTYRSFACSKCHPSGPPALYCTCHKGNPPTETRDRHDRGRTAERSRSPRIASAIVLVAGVAAAYALSAPVRTQAVSDFPPLATGLPLTQQPPAAAERTECAFSERHERDRPRSPANRRRRIRAQALREAARSGTKTRGASGGGTSGSKASAGSRIEWRERDSDSDDEHHETVKPKVRDEHSDDQHD